MQSFSEENYLKTIYHLGLKSDNKVSPTAIADALKNNPASVVDMLKKLGDKKFISYDKKKGARLTDKGIKAATEIVRKHRLWEVFLLEKLGYSWDIVHDIAEQMEHVQHKELADRLDKFLGYPDYDPHGDPIPKANGKVAQAFKTKLCDVQAGNKYRVLAVKDTSPEFLQYLLKLGITIGSKIKVLDKIAFDNSLLIQIGKGSKVNVSHKFGESVLVG